MNVTREGILEEIRKLYSNPCIELSPYHLKYAEERHKQLSEQLRVIDAVNSVDEGLREEGSMEKFLEELTALSRKHGLYIGARHEQDDWYAPLLVDSKTEYVIASSLCWYADGYDADKSERKERFQ